MSIKGDAKILVNSEEVQKELMKLLGNIGKAVLGDPYALINCVDQLKKSPLFVRDQLFLRKLELFVKGVNLSEEDSEKLKNFLTESGKDNDKIYRMIEIIDRVDSDKKLGFIINVTECLLMDEEGVVRKDYFRICNLIKNTLEEDLIYLHNHIDEKEFSYDDNVQGLLTNGLMYQSVIDFNTGDPKYSFTQIAYKVNKYAIDNEASGSNVVLHDHHDHNVKMITDFESISDEEIDVACKE